jgi:hypothetical protein
MPRTPDRGLGMRGVLACWCAITVLFLLTGPGAAKPRLRADTQAYAAAKQSTQSNGAKTRQNGSSKSDSSENDSSENGSSTNGNGKSQSDQSEDSSSTDDDEPDTSDIFGFTEGTDTSAKGTRVVSHDIVGRLGRRHDFGALRGSLDVTYSPSDRLQVSVSPVSDYEQSAGDPVLQDLRGTLSFGVSGTAKYRILERERDALVGLAVHVAPFWQRGTEITGGETVLYGAEFRAMLDYEFVPKKLFGALNLAYRPVGHDLADGTSITTATLEASAAISSRVRNDLYVGAEVRYLAHYEGAFFDTFGGWALFVGPTIYASLGESAYIGAAWNVQIAGAATAQPGQNLDLVNFERHQFRIKSGVVF